MIYPFEYRNRFGHPHVDVEERYLRQGSHAYRSDRDGAVTLHLGVAEAIKVTPHARPIGAIGRPCYWMMLCLTRTNYRNYNENNKLRNIVKNVVWVHGLHGVLL